MIRASRARRHARGGSLTVFSDLSSDQHIFPSTRRESMPAHGAPRLSACLRTGVGGGRRDTRERPVRPPLAGSSPCHVELSPPEPDQIPSAADATHPNVRGPAVFIFLLQL